ncbi:MULTISPECIES: LysR family transcriptional regulator ArgP [unclassified Halomonas]|uniref:LysR family transcriptional regulator ArgP n=1 Tax=unclassified Halomonas TaxID=2609666 RepID=UPI0007D9FA43|nr:MULTISPECIES: LysR family transcriptional regulator ArgP [unclassified Halomonas]MBT2787081.1 LysR family transcriptional regulator ArgP [Halomonas sp. ISL-106]MBT2795423.1 LysR family transcriptional regulator ArgP [Halomonas sp. ISL-104]OAL57931.1 transcriptional regulator ArgP [Halomonas sp. ALS9]
MLDYKLLHALATVVECAGFERAGDMLGLSQSAVSQRIKALEVRLGQPVLVRHPHLAPTPAGQRLLTHYQQVQLLERDLRGSLPTLDDQAPRLRIAINADSLVTWWAQAVAHICQQEGVLLDLVIEDQDVGLKRLRDGDVAACLCATPQPIAGARCVALGEMHYHPLASPDYVARHFPEGPNDEAFQQAPAIVFGPHDQLQHQFLAQCGYHGRFPYHLCPSSEGFVRLAAAGIGYGMMPQLQVGELMASGQLTSVAPGHSLAVPLYWHFWRHSGQLIQRLTQHLSYVTH